MNAHTPGPWSYYQNTERSFVVTPVEAVARLELEGVEICEVFFGKGIKDPEANARLTAASPEMYTMIVYLVAMEREHTQALAALGYNTKDAESVLDTADALIDRIDGVKE